MKPHELIQRRRRQRGAKAAPLQMRERHAAAAPAASGGSAAPVADPRNQLPARRPAFPGETRAQELERQRATATVVRPGAPPVAQQPAAPPAAGATPAAPPPPSTQNVITMCACPSHGEGECDQVATLRAYWPVPDGGAWPLALDVCEGCAAAIKADPVGAMVTGLVFVALFPPMHDTAGEDDDQPEEEDKPADGRQLRREWLEHRASCDECAAGSQLIPPTFCAKGGPLFRAMEAALVKL